MNFVLARLTGPDRFDASKPQSVPTPSPLTAACRADSIMGVSLFRDQAPDDFGVFTLGLYSMFRLTAGETQVVIP